MLLWHAYDKALVPTLLKLPYVDNRVARRDKMVDDAVLTF